MKFLKSSSDAQRGIALLIIAMLFFSLMDATAKGLSERNSSIMVVWARYTSQVVWSFLILSPWLFRLMRTKQLKMQWLRSALLFGATLAFFTSMRYLKLAEATAIFEIAPLLITILSVVILKETVGLHRKIGVAIGLLGALVIVRPGMGVFQWAALLPMIAAFFYASYSIATRFLGRDEPAATSFLYTALIGTIVASLMVIPAWESPPSSDIPIMISFGMIGGLGHIALVGALRFAPASMLAPFGYTGLMFNTLWGYAFFDEVPDLPTIIGGLIIVAAGLYVWHREMQARTAK